MIFAWGVMEVGDNATEKLKEFLVYQLGLLARKEGPYQECDIVFVTSEPMNLRDMWKDELDKFGEGSFGLHRYAVLYGDRAFLSTVQLIADVAFSNCLKYLMPLNQSAFQRSKLGITEESNPTHLADYNELIRSRIQRIDLKVQTSADRQRVFGTTNTPTPNTSINTGALDADIEELVQDALEEEIPAPTEKSVNDISEDNAGGESSKKRRHSE